MTTFLTTTQLDTLLTNQKDNFGGAGQPTRLDWYNWLNMFVYDKFVSINQNDYLSIYTIKTISGTSAYTLPTDFQDVKTEDSGLFEVTTQTVSDSSFGAINYDAETVAFTTVGQVVTGASSAATGTIAEIVDFGTTGTLRLTGVSGTFEDDEIITGATEGSATANGTLIPFDYSKIRRRETHLGDTQQGYFLDLTNINPTPEPCTSEVLILRYVPDLAELSDGSTTLIPFRFKQFAYRATEIFLAQYHENNNPEFLANQRFTDRLLEIFPAIRKTPSVRAMPRTRQFYTHSGRTTDNPLRYRLSDR